MSKYKRLTVKDEKYGSVDIVNDLGEVVFPNCGKVTKKALDRLVELEDKIEAGKLVELPLKVADTVYSVDFIFQDGYEIDKKGNERPVYSSGWRIHEEKITDKNIYKMCDLYVNDKVYTTREAAEEKLKELEKKLNELSEGKQ